jgi:hypothetical protein
MFAIFSCSGRLMPLFTSCREGFFSKTEGKRKGQDRSLGGERVT